MICCAHCNTALERNPWPPHEYEYFQQYANGDMLCSAKCVARYELAQLTLTDQARVREMLAALKLFADHGDVLATLLESAQCAVPSGFHEGLQAVAGDCDELGLLGKEMVQ